MLALQADFKVNGIREAVVFFDNGIINTDATSYGKPRLAIYIKKIKQPKNIINRPTTKFL